MNEPGAVPMFELLTRDTLLVYFELSDDLRRTIIQRARDYPKPLYYYPPFLEGKVRGLPDKADRPAADIVRDWVGDLIESRADRYRAIADKWGVSIPADRLWKVMDEVESEQLREAASGRKFGLLTPRLLDLIYEAVRSEAERRPYKKDLFQKYLNSAGQAAAGMR